MCEASAYLVIDGQEHLVMESVDLVEPLGENEWQLVNMFGERKTVTGQIKGHASCGSPGAFRKMNEVPATGRIAVGKHCRRSAKRMAVEAAVLCLDMVWG